MFARIMCLDWVDLLTVTMLKGNKHVGHVKEVISIPRLQAFECGIVRPVVHDK
jgi:hypothetical protein